MKDSFVRVAMLLIIVVLMFAWIMKPTNTPTLSQQSTPITSSTGIVNEEYKKAFVEACASEPPVGNYAFCECSYDYMDDRLTDKEMLDMASEYVKTEQTPEIMNRAVASCQYLYK